MRRTDRTSPRQGCRLDPKTAIVLDYVTDGPARGWLHTHGLARHGKPELELRNVPAFLVREACQLLNGVADYLLNDATAPLQPGQTMRYGADSILFVAARPDEQAGYEPLHYDGCIRLRLVDPPPGPCGCSDCAKDLTRRSGRPS